MGREGGDPEEEEEEGEWREDEDGAAGKERGERGG